MSPFDAFTENDTERLLIQSLISAQKKSIVDILDQGINESSIIKAVEHACWFAEIMAQKCTDPEQPPVACKAKCHWCCNQYVRVTAPEIFRATRFIKTSLSSDEQQALIERLQRLVKESEGLTAAQRGQLNRTCAGIFQGKCLIYEVRPLMCRRQTSYSVADCKKAISKGFPTGSILTERASLLTYSACIQGLSDGFEQVTQQQLQPLELMSAMLIALTLNDGVNRWISGEDIFAGAKFPVI